jgi:peptidylprolyl isomerase
VVAAGIASAATLLVAPRSDPPPPPLIVDVDEIAPRVTIVATDGCIPPSGEFPSLMAPDDVGYPGGASVTPSGVQFRVLAEGCNDLVHPGPSDVVTVRMAGWTLDGTEIVKMRGLMTLPLTAVIPGFRDGVTFMHVGDRFRLWVPSQLAYGTTTAAGRPSGDLTFDVELVDVKPPR